MLRRIWNITKIVLYILGVAFVLLTFLYVFLYHVPKSTTPVDVSLNMIKLDEEGNQIGTFPVTIKGDIEKYWFHAGRLNVDISPYDGYTEFKPGSMNNTPGGLVKIFGTLYTTYAGKGADGYEHFAIYFSEDLKYWAFVVDNWNGDGPITIQARYVGSTDQNNTIDDIKEYFGGWLKLE